MLVVNDRRYLGDSHLDPTENLAKLKENNQKLVERQKMFGQKELEDTERSAGPRMAYQELVRKLQKINLNIVVKDGSPGNIALYVLKTRKELAESVNEDSGDMTRHAWHKDFKYVTGCPKEPIPEYSTVTTDERGVANRELRGWRSVLIAMVKAKAITYQQAQEEFGPAVGKRSWRYEEQLQQHRAGFAG
jgi:hypothetical protein